MKEYFIQTKKKECYPFDEWITKLEMRAFGWVDKGIGVDPTGIYDLTINWEEETASIQEKKYVYNTFKRIKPYSSNLIFNLLEFLMGICSWVRRKLIFLLFGVTALMLGIGLFQSFAEGRVAATLVMGIFSIVLVYGPSLTLALAGFLCRKFFQLDAQLLYNLEKNGYDINQKV